VAHRTLPVFCHLQRVAALAEREDLTDITQLLQLAGAGDREARESLYRVVYDDLRRLARNLMRSRGAGDLESRALVNEVVLRFEKGDCLQSFENRRVFFSVAIRAMKQILISHYRRRKKEVGGSDQVREPLDLVVEAMEEQSGCDFEALNEALGELEVNSPRQHQVIMHRFFGGLTIAQTAEMLEISAGSVERDWRLARARLYRILRRSSG
jgi:RNA polymerase sigma factor (TIGR02999 family)